MQPIFQDRTGRTIQVGHHVVYPVWKAPGFGQEVGTVIKMGLASITVKRSNDGWYVTFGVERCSARLTIVEGAELTWYMLTI